MVEKVESGESFLSSGAVALIAGQLAKHRPSEAPAAELTKREFEILKLLAIGRSNKELAETLVISVKTVNAHRANIMRKLALRSYSDLIQYAIRHRLVAV